MRCPIVSTLVGFLAFLGPAWPTRADVAGQLRLGAEALKRRDLEAAERAYRRAFEADGAAKDEVAQAFEGLLGLAVGRGRPGDLIAYVEKRRPAASPEQQGTLLGALVRCYKARDGHLHGALAALTRVAGDSDAQARRVAQDVRGACSDLCKDMERLSAKLSDASVLGARRAARPTRATREPAPRVPDVPAPKRPEYQPRLTRLAPPQRGRVKGFERIQVRAPQPTRVPLRPPASVAKPPPRVRARSRNLAALFFSQTYQKATQLAGEGFVDSAKAEYAALMQLFPDTTQAQQAARYALHLFQRQRGAAHGGEALVAYLHWIRAVLGPKGSDYAEYLAFKSLASGVDPVVIAREAEDFAKRHPGSKWLPGIQLQLAVALDSIGNSKRAIEVLKPIASPISSALAARAAHVLAWLHIFQGEAAPARQTLEALAAQTVVPARAALARRLLEDMAAHALPKVPAPELKGAETPDEVLADRLLETADRFLRKGDAERAMDLYAIYLRVGDDSPGYYAARTRIERLKQTGRMDEE